MTDTLDHHSSLADIYHQFGHTAGLKDFLYDWEGGNAALFHLINNIRGGQWYDSLMRLISEAAQNKNFPYYFAGLFLFAGLGTLSKILRRQGGVKPYIIQWVAVLSVFLVGFIASIALTYELKNEFNYPRPYVAMSSGVTVIEPRPPEDNAYKSFPSGHTAFITVLMIALWPALYPGARWLVPLAIFSVGWSRIAMGHHFPADVLGGFLFTGILMLILQTIIYKIYNMLGLKC